jgi:uncharacterized membrane protein
MAADLESSRTLSGVGAVLLTVGSFVPPLGLVGIILLLIGLKGLGEYYGEEGIFKNALYGVIFGAIGIAVAIVVFISMVFRIAVGRMIDPQVSPIAHPLRFFFGIILILVVIFVFFVLEAIFFRRSFNLLVAKTGEGRFGTAGLLLLIGGVLTIIVVGFVILFVAWIITTVAFFSIKTSQQAPPAPPPPP